MAGQASEDLLQQTVDGFAQRVQDYASGIANRLGQPLSGTQLSQDEAVQRWNFSPLGSTAQADAAYHQLVAQGTPPGQALSQVYPMRQMLIQGPDVNASIERAKQIASWAAKASGTEPPEPFPGSTMPMALAQQNATPAPPVAPPPLPTPPVGLNQGPSAALPTPPPPVAGGMPPPLT